MPGGPKREERIGAISDEMLEREGFQGAETLMDAALLGGIELQAEAQFENEVLDFHHRELDRAIAHQESFMAWLSLSAPPVAMQAISSGLAGTDGAHHRHFSEAAERHRRSLIEMLNREFAERAGNEAWSYKAGRETWERAPRFAYEQPPLAHVAMQQRTSLLVLGGWLLITLALAARAARRVEVV